MNEQKRKNLEETYEQLSRSQKTIVVMSALGRVTRHWFRMLPLRWILMQIRIDMKLKASR
ncbi:MAG TPA: hypothetical protein VIV15_05090 [Anaerolineales bacterium]